MMSHVAKGSALAVVALFAVAALGACGASHAPQTVGDEIKGGRIEDGYPAVGYLRVDERVACSGTLVARSYVLTAAHCYDGANPTDVVLGERARAISDYDIHPSYRAATRSLPMKGLDIALVRLSEPVRDIEPATLSDLSEVAAREDLFVRSVGFGLDDTGDVGTKRSALEWITGVAELSFTTMGISGATDRGDSGGPVYLGRSIVGTTSSGFGVSVSMRIGAAREWLDAKTGQGIAWAPAVVTPDLDASREVCEGAVASLCSREGEGAAERERELTSCLDSYQACGQPPAFAVCLLGAGTCDHRVRCLLLPKELCLSTAPPKTWAAAARGAACEDYAQRRAACGGSRQMHLAECEQRFDECLNRIPASVACAIRDDAACDPDCLALRQCL